MELYWATRFKEYVRSKRNEEEVISDFLSFCLAEEKALEDRWKKREK